MFLKFAAIVISIIAISNSGFGQPKRLYEFQASVVANGGLIREGFNMPGEIEVIATLRFVCGKVSSVIPIHPISKRLNASNGWRVVFSEEDLSEYSYDSVDFLEEVKNFGMKNCPDEAESYGYGIELRLKDPSWPISMLSIGKIDGLPKNGEIAVSSEILPKHPNFRIKVTARRL